MSIELKFSKYIPNSPTPKQIAFLLLPHREALFGGAAGGGKVLYEDGVILTPTGFKKCADLVLGETVNNPDGTLSSITHLHAWNTYQVWRVHFHDGSCTDVAKEHLWRTWRSGIRKKENGNSLFGEKSSQIISTQKLKEWVASADEQRREKKRPNWPLIPVCAPQEFGVAPEGLDPYVLGLILGDGYIPKTKRNSVKITSEDVEHIHTELQRSGITDYAEDHKDGTPAKSFRLRSSTGVLAELKKLGLVGTSSNSKFIPDEYKFADKNTRVSVLQGLMDTDGYVDMRGQCYYCSVSKRLINDVKFVVESIGGTVSVWDKKTDCQLAYIAYIKLPKEELLFKLDRKRERTSEAAGNNYRRVVKVEVLDKKKRGRCLTVDHTNGLYITNDFIVTHNSDALLMAALQYPLAIDTLVPTPLGWSTIGKLKVGDKVFDEHGSPCSVLGKTKKEKSTDVYKLNFSDNSSIVADGNHLWPAETSSDRMSLGRGTKLPLRFTTTSEMFRTQQTDQRKKKVANWSIRNSEELDLPEIKLPIDPYVLGVWLGDGSKRDGTIGGIDPEIPEEFRKIGYKVKQYTKASWHASALRTQLENLGVRDNKHVPKIYLRASRQQRLDLLKGLMDTDGSTNPRWGQPEFANTDMGLIEACQELVHSLGWQTRTTKFDYVSVKNKIPNTIYKVHFIATEPVFRLPRKIKQQQSIDRKVANVRNHKWRIITSIEKLKTNKEVQCIAVDSPNHLFLVGKSMIPTHNCDVPHYSAIIFRRTITDAALSESILSRAREWLGVFTATKEVTYNGNDHTFTFPSGAKLTFAYMANSGDKYRYKSAQFQFVGYDESTTFPEEDYLYMFSRLRRTEKHKKYGIPLRLRAATNPGDIGHVFHKKRFDIRRDPLTGKFRGYNFKRPFIPSYITDNPFLDIKAYQENLKELPKLERDRLLGGDWDVQASARFKDSWFENRWRKDGSYYVLEDENGIRKYHPDELLRFGCIDSASSVRTGTEGISFTTKKQTSWSVVGNFAMTPDTFDLLWIHNWRAKCTTPILQENATRIFRKWKPQFFRVENNGIGAGVFQNLEAVGIPCSPVHAIADKLANSTTAQIRAERGRVWLPSHEAWLPDLESELFSWIGDPNETDDQIDVLSSAANEVGSRAAGHELDPSVARKRVTMAPRASGGMRLG